MDMRVEQLSMRSGVPVDTVRYYQSKGLLAPPRREGRIAWYDDGHLERLARIRSLQRRGFTLATIVRLVDGDLDAADEALIGELSGLGPTGSEGSPPAGPGHGVDANDGTDGTGGSARLGATVAGESVEGSAEEAVFTITELAAETGVPLALLKAVEAEGLLIPRRFGGQERYTTEDVAASRAGLLLLEWGIPLPALLDLSRQHHQATEAVAKQAVELFSTHVRGRLRNDPEGAAGAVPSGAVPSGAVPPTDVPPGSDDDPGAAVDQLLRAYEELLPAVTTLVGHHFTRALMKAALDHVEQVATDDERRAIWDQISIEAAGGPSGPKAEPSPGDDVRSATVSRP
jgi:DNA-binding transcriptional MerR regulator